MYKCYICGVFLPENGNVFVKHLTTVHQIKNRENSMICPAKCTNSFLTFDGLKKHAKVCAMKNSFPPLTPESPTKLCNSKENEIEELNITNAGINWYRHQVYEDSDSDDDEDEDNDFVKTSENYIGSTDSSEEDCNDDLEAIVKRFLGSILNQNLNQKTLNSIIQLVKYLINDIGKFYSSKVFQNQSCSTELLMSMFKLIMTELARFDSTFKRAKFIRRQSNYVSPKRCGIGTNWEMRRNKKTRLMIPHHVQSIYTFIPPSKTIKTMFQNRKIVETYMEYNQSQKHLCVDGVYEDFCCGEVAKRNELIRKSSNCLQIQVFIDGFELCDGLKTKTNMHAQIGVYFTIRNMPARFAYNQNNIHLIALINASDVKKKETDYTNILEKIVEDIDVLETDGISLDSGMILKG